MWMDVDTALSEVPVNVMPLLDDTDFKSVEEAVAFGDPTLYWHFTKTDGTTSVTAVTATSGGDYDWNHQDNGLYTIEIPASGGASINNTEEGFGFFSGTASGVLPWRGPVIGFRAAALNNAMVDGGDELDVNVTKVNDTSQTANDNGLDINTLITEMAKVPKSDGTTSWNATALADINAECDTALTDYDAVVAADFPLAANVTQIDGQATNGNNATLNLAQLNVVNSAGSAIVATSSGGNGHGMILQGNGTGEGLSANGGITGNGIHASGGGTSGAGIEATAGGNSHGISSGGAGSGSGIYGVGGSTGNGIYGISGAGATGDGIKGHSQATNGNGFRITGAGTGEGLSATGGATGHGANFIGGATSGWGLVCSGTTNGGGLLARSLGGDEHGIECLGDGSGHGVRISGGATGNGIYSLGGATSGAGIAAQAQTSGDGLSLTAAGDGHGLDTRGVGTGSGLYAEGGATGNGIWGRGGGTSGAGIMASAQNNNDPGLECIAHGSGDDLAADNLFTLAGAFTTDSGETYATSVSGSVVKEIADNAGGAALTEAGIADAVWDELITGAAHNTATSAGRRLREASTTTFIESGTADAGASGTITLENGVASSDNDWYDHTIVVITGGTGAGQARGIDGYVGSTRVATIHPDWVTAPDNTSTYNIMAFSEVHVHDIEDGAITASSFGAGAIDAAAIATDAVDADALATDAVNEIAAAVGGAAGSGAYATTLTIRTTGSTPLAGVGVWVNTANDMSGAVAGTSYTNSSGEVTFNLDYATHYVFCTHAGYNFAAANFTSSAGNVTFTHDIGTATSAGSSSVYDNSFLSRALTTVREMLDEPTINKKYSDNRIIAQLEKSYMQVIGEKNRNTRTPAVGTFSITVGTSTEQQEFALPHTVGEVRAVYVEGDEGGRRHYTSRSPYNYLGRGVWIEDKTLKIQKGALDSQTLKVEFVPAGVAQLHNGALTLNADGDAATFGVSPNVGALDTHAQAYLGCTLRILEVDGTTVTGNVMQERTITDYDNSTRVATLDVALSPIPTTDDGSIYYEIAPTIHKGMDEVVATYTAYAICLTEGNRKRADGILKRYQNEIRTLRLTAYYSRLDEATKARSDNYDNRRYTRGPYQV
jgi:hypothetical protein